MVRATASQDAEKFVSDTFQRRVKLQRDEDFKTIHSTDKKESEIKS